MKAYGKTRTSLALGRRSRVGHAPGIFLSPSGQSLLEVALLTPLLLALLLGVIELGRYAYFSILVGNAARAGAAYGAQNLVLSGDLTGIQTAADNDFQNNGQNISKLSVIPSTSCGCDSNGTVTPASSCSTAADPTAGTCISGHWVVMVSVTASGTINPLFNYPGIPKSLTVSNMATLRVAQR
jgi:Flp pilus assembly protein TadG